MITLTQPLAVQNRVLSVAKGKTQEELNNLFKAIQCNRLDNPKAVDTLAVWQAYMNGWRGNPEQVKQADEITDIDVCRKYLSLHSNAATRCKDFDLSISDVRKLLKTKKCAYTGVVMTKAESTPPKNTDRTIDRLDSTKGYVRGNVFAVTHFANSLKNVLFELDSEYKTTPETIHAMTGNIIKLGESK